MLYRQLPLLADVFPDPMGFAQLLQNDPGQAMQILEQAREQALGGAPPPAAGGAGPVQQAPMPGQFDIQFVPEAEQAANAGAAGGGEDSTDEDEDGEEDEDDEDGEERDDRPFALRVVQGIFGRWGGPRREDHAVEEVQPLARGPDNAAGRDSDID